MIPCLALLASREAGNTAGLGGARWQPLLRARLKRKRKTFKTLTEQKKHKKVVNVTRVKQSEQTK